MDLTVLSADQLREMERRIVGERQRREQQEVANAEANRLAAAYHAQMPCEMVNGVRSWSHPLAPVMGYPSGAAVWHGGQGWHNTMPGVNLTEPGAEGHTWTSWEESGVWMGDAPPPVIEEVVEREPTLGERINAELSTVLGLWPDGDGGEVYVYGEDAWELSWRVREHNPETGEFEEDGLFKQGSTLGDLVAAIEAVAGVSTGENVTTYTLHVPEVMAQELLPLVVAMGD